ncbi:MAG TPA: Arc family DNA-binding protein [Gammaproteobacteria bacterium]|jgi:plasmid stability protein
MPVSLSVKNVPEDLAAALRQRAAANHRSLQRELLSILEAAVGRSQRSQAAASGERPITIDELVELSRRLFPNGTESSVEYIRQMREDR